MSRTPVREALNQLAGEGLVEIRPRRGAVVAQATPQRIVEMFEVMAELEAMCARLAARRISPADLQRLEAAHESCRSAAAGLDSDAYFYANEAFHEALYRSSHNGFLTRSFEEHQAVVDALKDGDADRAVDAIRSHVLVQGERFADLLSMLQADATATEAA
ncbi:MAG: GntR family transcriptional regulator, partial [Burkholderiales bacterium]|nr:GntR family transcriptional regulator [Burkholderiales bacterium]